MKYTILGFAIVGLVVAGVWGGVYLLCNYAGAIWPALPVMAVGLWLLFRYAKRKPPPDVRNN